MEQNNFEKNIKRAFQDNVPMLDTNEIWNNIEPYLQKKKKRRFLLFWLFFAGLGMGMAFLFYNVNKSRIAPPHSTDTYSGSAAPKSLFSERSSGEAARAPAGSMTGSQQTGKDKAHQGVEKNDFMAAKKYASKKIADSSSGLSPGFSQTPHTQADTNPSANNHHAGKYPKETKAEKSKPGDTLEKNTLPPTSSPGENTDDKQLSPPPLITKTKTTETNKKKSIKKKKKKRKRKKKINPLSKIQFRPYFEMGAGGVLPVKILHTVGESEGAMLRRKRKETERQLEAFGTHAAIQLEHKPNGLFLLLGLQWQQLNERFSYNFTSTEIRLIQDTISYIENFDGEITSVVMGPKEAEVTTIQTVEKTNRHLFGYFYYGIGKRWYQRRGKGSLALSLGLENNFYYAFKGTMLNTDFEPVFYERKKNITGFDGVFRRKTGSSLWFAAELNRQINHRIYWTVSPKIQLPLKSISSPEYPLRQKYFKLSIDAGIRLLLLQAKKKK